MSDTIQVRRYTQQQAALRQLRPSSVMAAAESFQSSNCVYPLAINADVIDTSAFHLLSKSGSIGNTFVVMNPVMATAAIASTIEAADDWHQWSESATSAFLAATTRNSAPSGAAARRVGRLNAIQAVLGFSMAELASALRVSRQALYNWLDASKELKLHESSRSRLDVVERIAEMWRELSNAPLSSVSNETLSTGSTALGMLGAEVIDEPALAHVLVELKAKLMNRPKSRSQKLAEAGFSRRPSSRSLPSDE